MAVRVGDSGNENQHIVDTFEHYFGHLEIKLLTSITAGIRTVSDIEKNQSKLEEAYKLGQSLNQKARNFQAIFIMKKYDYYQPESLKEAFRLMEKFKGRANYIAGGTDIIVQIKQGAALPDALISLRSIEELKGINSCNGELCIGSMTCFRDLERNPVIADCFPALTQAVSVLASPQVRNVATIGGNICNSSPCADSVPPLMITEARVVIEGPGGRREVNIDDYFTGPGGNCMDQVEILTGVKISRNFEFRTGMAFMKNRRVAQDLAIASAAVLIAMDGKICRKCRIAAGSVAPVPLRLKNVEEIIEGEKISPELTNQVRMMVEKGVSPITDVRSTEEYRRTVTGVMVKRAIENCLSAIS